MSRSSDTDRNTRRTPSGVFRVEVPTQGDSSQRSVQVAQQGPNASLERTLPTSSSTLPNNRPAPDLSLSLDAMLSRPHNHQHLAPAASAGVVIVVGEKGSDWTTWVERYQQAGHEVLVVLQEPEESVQALSGRLRLRLRALLEHGRTVREAVLVSGQRRDARALEARSNVIRHMVGAMTERGEGRIWLDGKDRFGTLALATTVAPLIRGTGVSIRPAGRDALVA